MHNYALALILAQRIQKDTVRKAEQRHAGGRR
jgi:hypothetical protein